MVGCFIDVLFGFTWIRVRVAGKCMPQWLTHNGKLLLELKCGSALIPPYNYTSTSLLAFLAAESWISRISLQKFRKQKVPVALVKEHTVVLLFLSQSRDLLYTKKRAPDFISDLSRDTWECFSDYLTSSFSTSFCLCSFTNPSYDVLLLSLCTKVLFIPIMKQVMLPY